MNKEPITLRLEEFNGQEYILADDAIRCIGEHRRINSELHEEIERLNNIIDEIEKDIKNLYTYGIKNNAEQKDYLLNRLEGLKEYKGSEKE